MKMSKSYFQIYADRINSDYFQDLEQIYKYIEQPSKVSLEKLVSCIESTGAHGWFGLSSEISDMLLFSKKLDNLPSLKIRVEIERLKRLQYLGFIKPVYWAQKTVIELLNENRNKININEIRFWEMQAYGQAGWVTSNPNALSKLISKCYSLLKSYKGEFSYLTEAFNITLSARLCYLQNDGTSAKRYFENAIEMLAKENLLRPLSHVKMYYADHLYKYENKDEALKVCKDFLNSSQQSQFKSHLVLKALKIILSEYTKNDSDTGLLQHYVYRYSILVYAMGLNQSHRLYPILSEINSLIPENCKMDLYNFDAKAELKRKILALSWREYELFIKRFYELQDFTVIDLPENFPAFDLIADYKNPDNVYRVGIQVKKNEMNNILKKNVPSTAKIQDGIKKINSSYGNHKIISYKWHILRKFDTSAFEDLKVNSELCLGKNSLQSVDLDELVEIIFRKSQVLLSLLFTEDFLTK
jgi:hypothetical protein